MIDFLEIDTETIALIAVRDLARHLSKLLEGQKCLLDRRALLLIWYKTENEETRKQEFGVGTQSKRTFGLGCRDPSQTKKLFPVSRET